ncbi:MAG: hypothetical protein WA633_16060 [Stellaceae bacterium]
MLGRYAKALLVFVWLSALPAAALAQDDPMAKARQQFQPIPTMPPELPGNARKGRARQDALF